MPETCDPPPLSPRRLAVARLVALGLDNVNAAHVMGVREATVKSHLTQIMDRLGAARRSQVACWYVLTLSADELEEFRDEFAKSLRPRSRARGRSQSARGVVV